MTDNLIIQQITDSSELKVILKQLSVDIDKGGKKVLSDTSMYAFRQVPIWVGFIDTEPVTINVSYFGKRKKNAWMPYMNFYIAFTRIDQRRRYHAYHLAQHVRELAIKNGCIRLKSMACTVMGVRFHQKFNDQFWALNTKENVLLVDTPLVNIPFPTDTTPIEVRPWTDRLTPMTNEEIEAILSKGLKYDCISLQQSV